MDRWFDHHPQALKPSGPGSIRAHWPFRECRMHQPVHGQKLPIVANEALPHE